jgi:hypothetical protein
MILKYVTIQLFFLYWTYELRWYCIWDWIIFPFHELLIKSYVYIIENKGITVTALGHERRVWLSELLNKIRKKWQQKLKQSMYGFKNW